MGGGDPTLCNTSSLPYPSPSSGIRISRTLLFHSIRILLWCVCVSSDLPLHHRVSHFPSLVRLLLYWIELSSLHSSASPSLHFHFMTWGSRGIRRQSPNSSPFFHRPKPNPFPAFPLHACNPSPTMLVCSNLAPSDFSTKKIRHFFQDFRLF